MFRKLSEIWDPRAKLARQWYLAAQEYEERLRSNSALNPKVVDAVLQERNRILGLFDQLLLERKGQISIIVTKNARTEHCAVSMWKGRVYVLVSAALIGRPFDHPKETGVEAWEWLARHEIAHIRGGHLPWFFYTRRMFLLMLVLFSGFQMLSVLIDHEALYTYFATSCWILGAFWLLQMVVGLALEWSADVVATKGVDRPSVLQEAEKALHRMVVQARGTFPLGWLVYFFSMLFVDPHPPWIARRWLLRRRLRFLKVP